MSDTEDVTIVVVLKVASTEAAAAVASLENQFSAPGVVELTSINVIRDT